MVYLRANNVILNIEVMGRGEPVVLISDIGEDLTSWNFQYCAFRSRHFLLSLDNRGSGWSDCPTQPGPIGAMAQDVIAAMDLIGIEHTHLVGIGLGGMIALEIALKRPGRVRGLVLASSSAAMSPEQERAYGDWVEKGSAGTEYRAISEAMVRWLHSDWFITHDRWREHVIKVRASTYQWQSWEGAARQLEAMNGFDARDRLRDIRSPTLVVAGSEDKLTPRCCSEELAKGITGARTSTLNAGHMLHVELPISFNRVVLEFLAEVDRGADGGTNPCP